MPETFANSIDSNPIFAERAERDQNGRPLTDYICPLDMTADRTVALARALGVDRTTLYEASTLYGLDTAWTSIALSEAPTHFKWIEVYYGAGRATGTSNIDNYREWVRFDPAVMSALTLMGGFAAGSSLQNYYMTICNIRDVNTTTWTKNFCGIRNLASSSATLDRSRVATYIHRVVGVGRIAST